MSAKKEFGDFQTPENLTARVVALVAQLFGNPDLIIEPTAGLGSFLKASAECWGPRAKYEGYEINKEYVDFARKSLSHFNIPIFHQDFFNQDWSANFVRLGNPRILVIGNPPWVTNSALGQFGSKNFPQKTNFQNLRGVDARTGKSNFDIAEWMLIQLIQALPPEGAIAMLCKTMTARKVLRHFWKTDGGREETRLFHIDAKTEFAVAVAACLFFITGRYTEKRIATIYSDLDTQSKTTQLGLIDGDLVSNMNAYQTHKNLNGTSCYTWRSGVKHDAAKVMEFTLDGTRRINGFGELVEIEDDYVFPLLKSSDVGKGRSAVRKAVLVTQRYTGDNTSEIKRKAPNTWAYMLRHADILDKRKSSIYKKRSRFSIFGIGSYSFAPWKVAISGFYKNISFVVVPPCEGRPVMVDDTCYFIPCQFKEEAEFLFELLSSEAANEFLKSLIFSDSKRPITIDILRRLSFVELARNFGRLETLQKFVQSNPEEARAKTPMSLIGTETNISNKTIPTHHNTVHG